MNFDMILNYHYSYTYTYFITIATNYKYYSTIPIMKKFRSYIYNHDKNSHILSVKEFTEEAHGLHFHILVFTNLRIDYSKLHSHMPKHSDIRIELVQKRKIDLVNVLKYMGLF